MVVCTTGAFFLGAGVAHILLTNSSLASADILRDQFSTLPRLQSVHIALRESALISTGNRQDSQGLLIFIHRLVFVAMLFEHVLFKFAQTIERLSTLFRDLTYIHHGGDTGNRTPESALQRQRVTTSTISP